jgi:hypothetical protein
LSIRHCFDAIAGRAILRLKMAYVWQYPSASHTEVKRDCTDYRVGFLSLQTNQLSMMPSGTQCLRVENGSTRTDGGIRNYFPTANSLTVLKDRSTI